MTDRSELKQRLRAEARAPYRPLRKFIYGALGGSGLIGAVVFLAQLLAGKGDGRELTLNLAIQVGAIVLFAWLYKIDRDRS
jgi:hypothetical protein